MNKINVKAILLVLPLLISIVSLGQNYTSLADGAWTDAANWNNTSGWGGATPSLSYTSGTINVNHNMTISSNASFGGAGFNVAPGASITSSANFTISNGTANINGNIDITGNFTVSNGTTNIYGSVTASGNFSLSGGATLNVYGTLNISASATLSADLVVHPGGKVVVDGNVTVNSSNNLIIGTNTPAPPYADMIIGQNLLQQNSGDATINPNGRLAIFGNVSDNGGGGTFIRVQDGGQVYVHGDITYSGGGSSIQNNNTTSPYGFYVNGTVSNTGGGSSTTPNLGDQSTMESTNPDFFNWVATQDNSPLPVLLLFFRSENSSQLEVSLYWATAVELNNDHFTIERSRNGIDFQAIAQLPGNGTKNTRTDYSMVDQNPLSGLSYYRLRQTDYDGTSQVFPSIRVLVTGSQGLSVYPNPLKNQSLNIKLSRKPANQSLAMNIYNFQGRLVYSCELFTDAFGNADAVIELPSKISSGTYIVELASEESTEIQKIQVE